MKSSLMYMYGAVFLKLLYKSMLEKVTRGNRPLFPALVVNLYLCYDKWTIASESVDELTGIRNWGIDSFQCILNIKSIAIFTNNDSDGGIFLWQPNKIIQ